MTADDMKRAAARAALAYVQPGTVIGVGTGSTADHFVDQMAAHQIPIRGAIASSDRTAARLAQHGIKVLELGDLDFSGGLPIPVYVDGADETDPERRLIKGGGGALTREKIVAAASDAFVCIADHSKLVDQLGAFPLPVEVIPMAAALVAAQLRRLGGQPHLRDGFVTDNGNLIIDTHDLDLADPVAVEAQINAWAGVVTNGLFAARRADVVLLGQPDGSVSQLG